MADFKGLYAKAVCVGGEAGMALQPVPMIVGEAKSPFGSEIDHSKPVHYVADGVCGFAWVNVRPGNSAFAKWLVKNGCARKAYEGGVQIWIGEFNQSLAKKEACAYAMAKVFQDAGIKAYAGSRMD